MIVLIKSGLKNKNGWYVTVSNKKVIEVGKRKKKTYFFIQSWFGPLLCEKVNFLTAPAWSCRCCGQFDIGVSFYVWWLLISLARGLKKIPDVEILCPSEEFQTNWIFNREHKIQKHHFYCVANTIKVMFFSSLY